MKIAIRNLHPDVTIENLTELFKLYCDVNDIQLVTTGSSQRNTTLVDVPVDRVVAGTIARRLTGRFVKGQEVQAFVPLYAR